MYTSAQARSQKKSWGLYFGGLHLVYLMWSYIPATVLTFITANHSFGGSKPGKLPSRYRSIGGVCSTVVLRGRTNNQRPFIFAQRRKFKAINHERRRCATPPRVQVCAHNVTHRHTTLYLDTGVHACTHSADKSYTCVHT